MDIKNRIKAVLRKSESPLEDPVVLANEDDSLTIKFLFNDSASPEVTIEHIRQSIIFNTKAGAEWNTDDKTLTLSGPAQNHGANIGKKLWDTVQEKNKLLGVHKKELKITRNDQGKQVVFELTMETLDQQKSPGL